MKAEITKDLTTIENTTEVKSKQGLLWVQKDGILKA